MKNLKSTLDVDEWSDNFFYFGFILFSVLCTKRSHYKRCCIALFQIHTFHIITKCDHIVSIMMKCCFTEETMCCGKLGENIEKCFTEQQREIWTTLNQTQY